MVHGILKHIAYVQRPPYNTYTQQKKKPNSEIAPLSSPFIAQIQNVIKFLFLNKILLKPMCGVDEYLFLFTRINRRQ